MPNGVSGDSRVSRRGLLLAAPIGAGTRLAHAAARGRRLVPFLLPIALFLLIRYAYGDAVKAWFAADDFLWPLQEMIVEIGWGKMWTRPGLERKTRSLITLAMLTALNRPHELEIHLRGAVRNGCSEEEIREALLHAAVYCGFPAAIDAFRVAKRVLAEEAKPGEK